MAHQSGSTCCRPCSLTGRPVRYLGEESRTTDAWDFGSGERVEVKGRWVPLTEVEFLD